MVLTKVKCTSVAKYRLSTISSQALVALLHSLYCNFSLEFIWVSISCALSALGASYLHHLRIPCIPFKCIVYIPLLPLNQVAVLVFTNNSTQPRVTWEESLPRVILDQVNWWQYLNLGC